MYYINGSKMKIRTYMILDALKLGYTVVHTDADIYYVMNPLDDIVCSGSCHLAALWDDSSYNAGFVYVRPTTTGTPPIVTRPMCIHLFGI